jgi:hypothetical protein
MTPKYQALKCKTFLPRRPGHLATWICASLSEVNVTQFAGVRCLNLRAFSHSTQNVRSWRCCHLCRYLLGYATVSYRIIPEYGVEKIHENYPLTCFCFLNACRYKKKATYKSYNLFLFLFYNCLSCCKVKQCSVGRVFRMTNCSDDSSIMLPVFIHFYEQPLSHQPSHNWIPI